MSGINETKRKKAIALGTLLLEQSAFDKREFLEMNTALSQTETASVLGIRPRDVQDFLTPSFYVNSRPKYIQRDVLALRDKWMKQAEELRKRNRQILQEF